MNTADYACTGSSSSPADLTHIPGVTRMNAPEERLDELADLPMREAGVLSAEKMRFVEGMGRYFEQFGISRIGGRILGFLMLAEEPVSLDDMATTLSVSR